MYDRWVVEGVGWLQSGGVGRVVTVCGQKERGGAKWRGTVILDEETVRCSQIASLTHLDLTYHNFGCSGSQVPGDLCHLRDIV